MQLYGCHLHPATSGLFSFVQFLLPEPVTLLDSDPAFEMASSSLVTPRLGGSLVQQPLEGLIGSQARDQPGCLLPLSKFSLQQDCKCRSNTTVKTRRQRVMCKASTQSSPASKERSAAKGRANTSLLETGANPPISADPSSKIVTAIPEAPITQRFPVPEDLDQIIPHPGVPRANNTPTLDYPSGLAESDQMKKFLGGTGRTVLQQHVDFFDTGKFKSRTIAVRNNTRAI